MNLEFETDFEKEICYETFVFLLRFYVIKCVPDYVSKYVSKSVSNSVSKYVSNSC